MLLVAGCATPSGPGATPAASEPPGDGASDKPFKSEAYKVDIVAARGGDLDRRLKRMLERSSQLVALADRPPLTEAGLRRRIEGDIERFNIALRSEGYYAASITSEIERAADPLKSKSLSISVRRSYWTVMPFPMFEPIKAARCRSRHSTSWGLNLAIPRAPPRSLPANDGR